MLILYLLALFSPDISRHGDSSNQTVLSADYRGLEFVRDNRDKRNGYDSVVNIDAQEQTRRYTSNSPSKCINLICEHVLVRYIERKQGSGQIPIPQRSNEDFKNEPNKFARSYFDDEVSCHLFIILVLLD